MWKWADGMEIDNKMSSNKINDNLFVVKEIQK